MNGKSRRIISLIALLSVLFSLFTVNEQSTSAAVGDGSPSDPNFKYVGRWDTSNAAVYKGYWSGSYFRVNFTGTTVKLKLAAAVSVHVSIDGGPDVHYPSANGTVNLTPTPLSSGTHTLRVSSHSEVNVIQFQGLILDSGAQTQPPVQRARTIEFIGDSITAGCCALSKGALHDYAWLAGEYLNVEHTQIAYSGICLVTANCGSLNGIGMDNQFFKLRPVDAATSPLWDFNRYQADAVVINIGTNDNSGISDTVFQNSYISFLQNIRVKYPNAEIFALRAFGGFRATQTLNAVQARHAAGDRKVHYIDTTGWVTPGTSDFSDGLHPSESGHVKIAAKLAPILSVNALWEIPKADNFSDGIPDGWTNYGGTWSVVSGQYQVASNSGAKSIAQDTLYSNFIYEADVTIGATGNAGLIFRASSPSIGVNSYTGYYAGIQGDQVILGKAANNWTLISSVPVTLSANTAHRIKVDVAGSRIKVYVDNMTTPKINVTDSSYVAGSIGLRTNQTAAKFDNINVAAFSRLEASNVPRHFIRHRAGRAQISKNFHLVEDSQWRITTGLASATGVSFESVNYPGFYLRHKAGEVWMELNDGSTLFKADATWNMRPGLWDSTLVSFQSYNYPTGYLRHMNSLLYMNGITTDLDKKDATFKVH